MKLEEFLRTKGDIIARGYWSGGGRNSQGDASPKIRNGKTAPKPFDEAYRKYPYLLLALQPYVVIVDYDDPDAFQCRLEIAKANNEHCIVIQSPNRGGHFYWYDHSHMVQSSTNKNKTLLTLTPVDYKCGYKVVVSTGEIKAADLYGCISKDDKSLRDLVYYNLNDDNTLDEVPFYDLKLKSDDKFKFLDMGNHDGRQATFFEYMIPVKRAGYTYEQFRLVAELIEQYLLDEPLGDEFENAVRIEAWDSVDTASTDYFSKNKFLHNKFAESIREKYHIKKINGQLHAYNDGIYEPGYDAIERVMISVIPSITSNQRKEVLNYLNVICENQESNTDLNLIAFKNGILNLNTDTLEPFSPDHIITNKIPWNYNPGTSENLADDILNRLSCGDEDIRCCLEEVAGACLYRSAAVGGGMAAVLIGDKHNGKSTYIHMIESMIGERNYSAADLGNLKDRFTTITLYGKLANIGDDISSDYITDTSILKKLITGEVIQAEEKGKNPVHFRSYAMHIYSANDFPRTKDPTGAVSRRMLFIPLNGKFTKDTPGYDPFIRYKLEQAECMERFIYLAVCGLHNVLDNKSFTVAEKSRLQKESYEKENNPILTYIDEVGEDAIVNQDTGEVFRRYQLFCLENGYQSGSNITFSKAINRYLGTETKKGHSYGRDGKRKTIKIFVKQE